MIGEAQMQIRQRNMHQLWILILLFALPPIAAWLFFFNPQWLPEGRTNHGQIIEPPRPMQGLTLRTDQGVSFDWTLLQEQWTLVVLAEAECTAACTEQLIKLRQIRRAMGANRQRIERLLILLPDDNGRLQPPSLDGLEGTRLALADSTDKGAILERFTTQAAGLDKSLFLIDPRIDLMMTHDLSRITSKQVLQDLERLLKASQSWVKGGQYGHK